MCKSFFVALIFVLIIFSNIILAQSNNSIQINGGLLIPMSASKGLSTSIQYNYSFNSNIQFYIYTGYSNLDKFYASFLEQSSSLQQQTHFSTYIADKHILIPLYIGSRINIQTNKLFTFFTTIEAGYSYLSYNAYEFTKDIDPVTGVVLAYNTDLNTKEKRNENLFGVGAGVGLSHPINSNMNVILSFKLNSQINSSYYSFFSNQGTYTAFNLGFNINI